MYIVYVHIMHLISYILIVRNLCSGNLQLPTFVCNQCLSPMKLWVRISIRARCTTLCNKVCQCLAIGRWFFPGTPFSFTNKTDRHDITDILLKVALNIITPNHNPICTLCQLIQLLHVYTVYIDCDVIYF